MGRFANKLFEKLTYSIKEDSMDELDYSEKQQQQQQCMEFLPLWRAILKTWNTL